MIFVGGNRIGALPEAAGFEPNALRKSIFAIMLASETAYRYDDAGQLLFELRLRDALVTAARALARSGMAFRVFRESTANPNFWQRTGEGGFRLRDGVRPSDAVRDIYARGSLYGTECATAMVIVYYGAMLHVLTEDVYNRVYAGIYLMDWMYLDRDLFLKQYNRADDALPGDARYFANPDVNPLTPEWQGENVFDLGGGMYYGHGMGVTRADRIIRALNGARREGATRPAYLMDMVKRQDYKRLARLAEDEGRS